MKRLMALTIVAGSLALAGPIQASGLPRVYIGFPNPAPCKQSVKMHGKYVDHRVACYQVRPSTISVSEDGDGFLSDITWSAWTATAAKGSGLQAGVASAFPRGKHKTRIAGRYRCSNSGGTTYCEPRIMSYNVPATIRLSVPVSTSAGVDFTRLRASSSHRMTVCLPPANSC